MMAFAMSFNCAFAQFGQLTGSGSEKKSKKVEKQALIDKENAKKGIVSTSQNESRMWHFINLNYEASFEAFDYGAYGVNYEALNAKSVVAASVGFHTNAGIVDSPTFEMSVGPNFTAAFADSKLFLYAPLKFHLGFPDEVYTGLSLTPTVAYRINKFSLKAGVLIRKNFIEGSKFTAGLSIGLGYMF